MSESKININIDDTQLSQSELNYELIGHPPGWILNTGISTIALAIIVLLIGAYYIQYPDKILAQGIITTEIAPLEVKAQSTGIINEVYIQNETTVDHGQELFYLKNTAIKEHMIILYKVIEQLQLSDSHIQLAQIEIPNNLQVGSLSQGYADLINLKRNLGSQLKITAINQQVVTLNNEIKYIHLLNQSLNREKVLYKRELDLTMRNNERNNILLEQGVISDLEFENIEKVLLQQQRQYESMGSSIVQNNVRIEQLIYLITKAKEDYQLSINSERQLIENLLTDLKERYRNWYENNHILSEGNGTIEIKSNVDRGVNISQGQVVAYLVPCDQKNKKYVRAKVPSQGVGKIMSGAQCIIRIQAYPYKEYGSIISSVEKINQVPDRLESGEALYELSIPLNNLITNQGNELEYRPNMEVEIQIITESKNILTRIFEELNNIISQNL